MSERPTPETDAVRAYEGNWDTKALRMTAHARKLERERDEAREALVRSNHFLQQAEENLESIYKERDEAREALMEIESVYVDGCDTCADRERMGSIARAALAQTNDCKK